MHVCVYIHIRMNSYSAILESKALGIDIFFRLQNLPKQWLQSGLKTSRSWVRVENRGIASPKQTEVRSTGLRASLPDFF